MKLIKKKCKLLRLPGSVKTVMYQDHVLKLHQHKFIYKLFQEQNIHVSLPEKVRIMNTISN